MSTCARCGLPHAPAFGAEDDKHCFDAITKGTGANDSAVLFCRDRQIAAQAALLRSVTISLEQAAGYCESGHAAEAAKVLDGVLERLS